jgi:hypothetical protein
MTYPENEPPKEDTWEYTYEPQTIRVSRVV